MHYALLVFSKTDDYDDICSILEPYEEGVNKDSSKWLWDWFQFGGRYSDSKFIPEKMHDGKTILVKNVDISGMDAYKARLANEWWDHIFEGKKPSQQSIDRFQWAIGVQNKTDLLWEYRLKDIFVKWHANRAPGIAFITSDGAVFGGREFVDIGNANFDSSIPDKRLVYIDKLGNYIKEHQDEYVTLIDCHI